MSAQAIVEAVELATIVTNLVELDDQIVVDAIVERLGSHPVRALSAQATLCGVIGQLAEQRLAALLRDAELLDFCAQKARAGQPVTAATVGVTTALLLREAGVSAARLDAG